MTLYSTLARRLLGVDRRLPAVLVVTNLLEPQAGGGAEIVAARQARAIARSGHRVSLLAGWAPEAPRDPGDPEWLDRMPVYRFPDPRIGSAHDFFSTEAAAFLRAVMDEERPDIVHFHNLNGLGANLVSVAADRGARVVWTLHDVWSHCLWATRLRTDGGLCTEPDRCAACRDRVPDPASGIRLPVRLRRDFVARALDRADALVSPSAALARSHDFLGVPPGKLRILPNGIDLAGFGAARRPSSRVRFAYVGTLREHKGVRDLIEAAAILGRDPTLRDRWSLSLVGEGPLRLHAERVLAEAGLAGNVALEGRLPSARIPDLLSRTDVVVLPSRCIENQPTTLLEAIAAGRAQIGTAQGGIPELIVDGCSGRLVAPGDPAALAAAMEGYVRSPDLAAEHGAFNRARRSGFSADAAADGLAGLYAELTSGPRPALAAAPAVVICSEPPHRASFAALASLDALEGADRIRLVWSGWASEADWDEAVLLWILGTGPDATAALRAIGAGIPVLAPRRWRPDLSVPGEVTRFSNALEACLLAVRLAGERRRGKPGRALRGLWRDRPASRLQDGGDPELAAAAAAFVAAHPDLGPKLARAAFELSSLTDEPIEFGAGREGTRWLAAGWSAPEPFGVWSDGPKAALRFGLDPSVDLPAVLSLSGQMFDPPGRPGRSVCLEVGERIVADRIGRDAHGFFTLPVRLDDGMLDETGCIAMTFHVVDPLRPSDTLGGADHRRLGLALHRAELQS